MSTPYYADDAVTLHHGDALHVARQLDTGSVDCIVTSPPYYGLRDYGSPGQYGMEETPAAYVETMRALFNELRRVLTPDGTLWLNLGDSYSIGTGTHTRIPQTGATSNGTRTRGAVPSDNRAVGTFTFADVPPHKNMLGIPWRVAFALQADGWILRNDIIWTKPNAMPESITDRLSNRHEHLFMFSKSRRYWFDLDAVREQHISGGPLYRPESGDPTERWVKTTPTNHNRTGTQGRHELGKNPGDVWEIPTSPFPGAHFATFPRELPRRCILAGCKPGGTVLDPFSGSGTTGLVAGLLGRRYVGVDISTEYLDLSLRTRLAQGVLDIGGAS